MTKYEQLENHQGTIFGWWSIRQHPETKVMYLQGKGQEDFHPIISVNPDDSFVIQRPALIVNADKSNMVAYLTFMPYPVIIDRLRNGIFINNALYDEKNSQPMYFNASGECTNPLPVPEDTKEKRKQFNKFMLNWEKLLSATVRMDTPKLEAYSKYSRPVKPYLAFLQEPSVNLFEYIKTQSEVWGGTTQSRYIKNFRRRHQNKLYQEYLNGKYPEIEDF